MTPAQRENFLRLLNPRHIAFVGGRDAITAITEARRRGYDGQMWAVNPNRDALDGVPCYPTVADLPDAPDAAYVAVPASAAIGIVEDLACRGAGGAVCYSAGFKEAGPDGKAAEDRLRAAVGDMALIGPNCYGMINYIGNAALWSFAHGGTSPGYGAAIITQSGMLSSDITMAQRSLPLAYMISAGNQTVMGQEDFMDVLCEDPAVRAIGLHIEGLRDIPRFEQAALKALGRGVPVVALKTGTSAIGAQLTISHTGSLSGENELYEALFARTGVISVSSPVQLLETLKFLCVAGAPKGPRVAGFTCSGGGATMLADRAEKVGLCFPPVTEAATQALTDLLPDVATVSNPLDYTTPIWGQAEFTGPVFAAGLAGMGADAAVLVQDYPAPGLDGDKAYYTTDAAAFAEAAAKADLPRAICATIPENLDLQTREALVAKGVAPMQGIHETLNAIAHGAAWSAARARINGAPPEPLRPGAPVGPVVMTSEAAGKAWVARAGISVPQGRVVGSADAVAVAAEVGYPVALKMISPRIAHKTEAGAVALGLASSSALEAAIEKMRRDVSTHDPEATTDQFLVERMSAPPIAELIVALRRDPQFGCALTLGSGGILVELVGDAQTLLLPCSVADVHASLASLRVSALLSGFRGGPVVDRLAVAERVHALCTAFLENPGEIAEVEINPLFVTRDDLVAVDVLMHRTDRSEVEPPSD